MWLLSVIGGLLLAGIAFQDFKSRSVSLYLLVSLALLFAVVGFETVDIKQWAINTTINWVLIFIQLGAIKLAYTIYRKEHVQLADSLIGWGDIVFLFIAALIFSPFNFILFYVSGMFLVLLGYGISTYLKPANTVEVPLAGGLSVWLVLVLVLQYISPSVVLQHDDWVLNVIR